MIDGFIIRPHFIRILSFYGNMLLLLFLTQQKVLKLDFFSVTDVKIGFVTKYGGFYIYLMTVSLICGFYAFLLLLY